MRRDQLQLLLGLGIGGAALYFLLRSRSSTPAGLPIVTGPVNLSTEVVEELGTTGASPSTQASRIGQTVGTVGGAAVGAIFGAPQVGAAIGGIAGNIGGAIFGAFIGKPLDPVSQILIAEMPYAYAGTNNVPPNAAIYALDKYGYLWPVQAVNECGYSWREIIAVNAVVFSMMPRGTTEICSRTQIDPMPRPADPAVLRGAFGNDIRFKLGASNDFHGPWEGANAPPIAGTPAAWEAIAGSYVPTKVYSPGEF